jgi:hypothetical protein
MPLPIEIQNALRVYDDNKGFWRRLFRRDQAAIRALRTLNDADQTNLLKIYQCFIENLPKNTQESYKVYQTILIYLSSIDFNGIPRVIDELHFAKLSRPQNIDKITHLKANHFRMLANLLNQLSMSNLLTQANFDNIAKHLETPEENIPLEFSVIVSAVDILNGRCLNQENLNSLLEKPMQAANMASALKVLDANGLLTPTNRIEFCNDNNQFLLSNDAYNLVWRPLETYLPTLAEIDEGQDEGQSVFDRIIDLAQQENPEEKIERYLNELNSEFDMPRVRHEVKFSTAPPASRRNTGDSLASNHSIQFSRQPTI